MFKQIRPTWVGLLALGWLGLAGSRAPGAPSAVPFETGRGVQYLSASATPADYCIPAVRAAVDSIESGRISVISSEKSRFTTDSLAWLHDRRGFAMTNVPVFRAPEVVTDSLAAQQVTVPIPAFGAAIPLGVAAALSWFGARWLRIRR